MKLRLGQVVVSETDQRSWLSRAIAWFTKSPATHVWIVTFDQRGVEAHVPRVETFDVAAKLATLEANDQAYAVLDYPGLHLLDRLEVAMRAESFIGERYDFWQLVLFAVTGKFWSAGTGTLICSRLITACFLDGAHVSLFPEALLAREFPATFPRLANLRAGYATPADLLTSKLQVVAFHPSSRIPTIAAFEGHHGK